MHRYLIVLFVFLLAGCIAGAGSDYPFAKMKAEKWETIISSKITTSTDPIKHGDVKQRFDEIFHDFTYFSNPIKLKESERIGNSNYSISYNNYNISINNNGKNIVSYTIPNIFYMHPLNAALIKGPNQNHDIILSCIRSRSTTGLVYIGIFRGDGEILFSKIHKSFEVWDITKTDSKSTIAILGSINKTTLFIETE